MFWTNFKAFMAEPFSSDNMDAKDWFLFLGLVIAILMIWHLIFNHIVEVI